MKERKKKLLDGIDKEILRSLYAKRPLVSSRIAKAVGLSSSAISPRLNSLREMGIIKILKISKVRTFERNFGELKIKIESPRSIFWDLDFKND